MQARKEAQNMGILEPQERLRILTNYSSSVEIDPRVPPRSYYRTGLEMVQMANVYLEEGSLENAYVLYMKFMTLFLKKIRKHPDYTTVPVTDKSMNQAKLREVLPKAEKLKVILLEQFTKEYKRHLAEVRQREKQEHERRRREAEKQERLKNTSVRPTPEPFSQSKQIVLQPSSDLDDIYYPDPDLPSAPVEFEGPEDISQGSQGPQSSTPTWPTHRYFNCAVLLAATVIPVLLLISSFGTFQLIPSICVT